MENKSHTYIMPKEINLRNLNNLAKKAEDYLNTTSRGEFYLDLSHIDMLNSISIGYIIKVHNTFSRKKREIILVNVCASVLNILESTGLLKILNIQGSNNIIDTSDAVVDIKLDLDFEVYKNFGIFKFGGSMLTPGDAGLFFSTAERILTEGHKMLLDMSDLAYIDSMGLGSISKLYDLMKKQKGEIRICGAGDILKNLLDQNGLSQIIRIYNTRDEAVKDWISSS